MEARACGPSRQPFEELRLELFEAKPPTPVVGRAPVRSVNPADGVLTVREQATCSSNESNGI
jgi:hypothetical protein